MREKVLQAIREQKLMRAGDRVAAAVSAGADSVALLRLLLELRNELGIVLAVAHFNHGLRAAESDADQAFVAELARQSGLEFFAGVADVRDHAVLNKLSVEAAGRELRYAWLARLAKAKRLDAIATAHTLDDQAETVLLKFFRGAGTRGLAGIWPALELEPVSEAAGAKAPTFDRGPNSTPEGVPFPEGFVSGHEFTRADKRPFNPEPASAGGASREAARVVRPLLAVTRDEVEAYLESLGQTWREDASNLDHRFLRNRVRHELLPLLEREYNPNIRQAMSDVAEIARVEEEYWQAEVERELSIRRPGLKPGVDSRLEAGLKARSSTEAGPHASAGSGRLLIEDFARLPPALQRRVLKRFAEDHGMTLDFEHVEEMRRVALGELERTELPGGLMAVSAKQWLELRSCSQTSGAEYEIQLPIPGEAQIDELGLTVRATIVPEQFGREVAPGELLSRDLMSAELTIRNWRPGDRIRPAHRGSEEKLKRLFAEKKIPADERPRWPVALCGNQIVWVRGFAVAKAYCWSGTGDGVRIEIVPSRK